MEIKLDEQQIVQIQEIVLNAVKSGVQAQKEEKPLLNRKEIAKFLGVAESTVNNWVALGMPFIEVDKRKFYSKNAIKKWLITHEKRVSNA